MTRSIFYIFILSLIISGVVFISSYLIANILQNYVVYIGFYPTYPLAWLAPIVRMIGQILSLILFILFFVLGALRSVITS